MVQKPQTLLIRLCCTIEAFRQMPWSFHTSRNRKGVYKSTLHEMVRSWEKGSLQMKLSATSATIFPFSRTRTSSKLLGEKTSVHDQQGISQLHSMLSITQLVGTWVISKVRRVQLELKKQRLLELPDISCWWFFENVFMMTLWPSQTISTTAAGTSQHSAASSSWEKNRPTESSADFHSQPDPFVFGQILSVSILGAVSGSSGTSTLLAGDFSGGVGSFGVQILVKKRRRRSICSLPSLIFYSNRKAQRQRA